MSDSKSAKRNTSRLVAFAAVIGGLLLVGAVPIAVSIVAVAAIDYHTSDVDHSTRAAQQDAPDRPFLSRVRKPAEGERERAAVNWSAAAETKGDSRIRRVPCSTCPGGSRYVVVPQESRPHVHRPPSYATPSRYPYVTPADLGFPPGSRIVSVTERVVTPYQARAIDPHDEVKTGAYECPRCRHHHLGSKMHSVTTLDGEPVPVLCEHCWGQTTQSQRAAYLQAEMLRRGSR